MVGDAAAPVTLVEFFDYGCPACVQLKPTIDQVFKENQSRLKVYYKMYPLVAKHPDSMGAAKAALAAHAQGKFHAMHDIIFAKFGAQKADDLRGYAQQIGLDMGKYAADFAAAEARVKADMQDGEAVGVDGTPTLFLNGRKYPGPSDRKYFAAAIEEELAVRR
jgi:protein-disulfide isomerase